VVKKSQRCTPASHAVRPAHSWRRLSATEAGWRSVRSSHLYHCRRRHRPRYQLMGRHLHHCRTDCLYYGRVSQRAGQCHLAISTAEVLEAEVTWDVGQSRVTCPRCHAAGFSRAGSDLRVNDSCWCGRGWLINVVGHSPALSATSL